LLSLDGHISEREAIDFLTRLKSLPAGDDSIDVLIVRLRVGGGALGPAQSIAEGLQFLREDTGIPTVALVTEMALSAGFYAAVACDHVVATPAALVGAMGSIVRTFDIDGALQRLGIRYSAVTSGAHKDSLFFIGERTPEQQGALQAMVDDGARQFLDYVGARRPAAKESLEGLGGGQIISGRAALALGLIDELGGLFAAIAAAARQIDAASISLQVLDDPNPSGGPGDAPLGHLSALLRALTG
jgi:protease IV